MTAPFRRWEQPLIDIYLRILPAVPLTQPGVGLIDLESWSETDLDKRAEGRRQIAAVLRALAEHGRNLIIGLDVLLQTETFPEADLELAAAIEDTCDLITALEVDQNTGEVIPFADPFAGIRARKGIVNLETEWGIVRRYGVNGSMPQMMACRLGASAKPDMVLPRRPFFLRWPFSSQVDNSWIVLRSSEIIHDPRRVAIFNEHSIVLIGLLGSADNALDAHLVVTRGGKKPVSGVCVHGMAVESLLAGDCLHAGGVPTLAAAAASWQLLFLLLLIPIRRLLPRNSEPSVTINSLVASAMAVVTIPTLTVFASLTDILISPLAIMFSPLCLVLTSWLCSALVRRGRFFLVIRPRLGHCYGPIFDVVYGAFVTADPTEKLQQCLRAFEDLTEYIVIGFLSIEPDSQKVLEGRKGRKLAKLWYKKHTLFSVSFVFKILAESIVDSIREHQCSETGSNETSQVSSTNSGQRNNNEVANGLEIPLENDWFDAFKALGCVFEGNTGGETLTGRTGTVWLRNAMAHHNPRHWLSWEAAVQLSFFVQRQILSLLDHAASRKILFDFRLETTPDEKEFLFVLVEHPETVFRAFPWLVRINGVTAYFRGLSPAYSLQSTESQVVYENIDGDLSPDAKIRSLKDIEPFFPNWINLRITEKFWKKREGNR